MNKIFLDTNVILDLVTKRDGFEDACDILQIGDDGKAALCVSYLTMANTDYVARKGRSQDELYAVMESLVELVDVLPMDEKQLKTALDIKAADLEDVLQYVCASTHKCDAIITRNTKHFPFSEIPVMTPKGFLNTMC
ncbi:MAG: type II toxin-antitoxin system VapC family toxin [Muribaculaceae bacterium]